MKASFSVACEVKQSTGRDEFFRVNQTKVVTLMVRC